MEKMPRPKQYKGVVVFDIDGTLTFDDLTKRQGERKRGAMIAAMDYCRERDFAVAVNTARPPQSDILFGIPRDVLKYLLTFNPSIHFRPSPERNIQKRKWKNMGNIAREFNVPVYSTILVDDLSTNCEYCERRNVPALQVSDGNGVGTKDLKKLRQMMEVISSKSSQRRRL